MKAANLIALALALGALGFTHSSYAATQTLTGEISSSNCGASHMAGMTAPECTRQCVDAGAAYVLVVGNKIYRFANQADPQLRAHAGETVSVMGDVKGDFVTASKIDAAPAVER